MSDKYIIPITLMGLAIVLVLTNITIQLKELNNTMDIYLRRNLDISFSCSCEAAESLKALFHETTPEQKVLMEESERKLEGIKEAIWQHFADYPTYDLTGNLITRQTHEIGFDFAWEEREDGSFYGIPTKAWIRPSKSEYEHNTDEAKEEQQ